MLIDSWVQHEHPNLICLFLEKILKPMGWQFRMSFQSIFVVYIVDAEPNSITWIPFIVVQQWPCKVSLNINAIPTPYKEVKAT